MPNMIKVGKTTRQPSLRAQELSNVTGVPTPFLVVYEKQFNDCDSAENFIHELLSIKGFRVSANREFFNAPVHDVIEAVLQAISFDLKEVNEDDDDCEYFDSSVLNDELDDLLLAEDEPQPVWLDIWNEARSYDYGSGDTLQDYDEAMRLYKQSTKLGCILAYDAIGRFYQTGKGCARSEKKALDWYKEGAKNKNYICYISMAKLFLAENNNKNAEKCLQLFCKTRNESFNKNLEEMELLFCVIAIFLTWLVEKSDFNIPREFIDFLSINRVDLAEEIDSYAESDEDYVVLRAWFDELIP